MHLFVPFRVIVAAAVTGALAAVVTTGVDRARHPHPAVRFAAGIDARPAAAVVYRQGQTGFDVSWPQCGQPLPRPGAGVAIVGVNGGQPFTANPCFSAEWAWAASTPTASVYINLDRKAADMAAHGWTGPQAGCATADAACAAYDEGWSAAAASVAMVDSAGARPVMWWLDVEAGEDWGCGAGCDTRVNARLIQGAADLLRSRGLPVGIYSDRQQWAWLAGGYAPGLPVWTTDYDDGAPQTRCGAAGVFGGGQVYLVQSRPVLFDGDYACGALLLLR